MNVSVCLFVCPQSFSRLYRKDYSSDRFQILHTDSTYPEDMQRCSLSEKIEKCQNYQILKIYEDLVHFRLNVQFCPGCFSKTIHRIVFKIHILLLQISKMCNVLVLIENKLSKLPNFENI